MTHERDGEGGGVARIGHYAVRTGDLDASKRFYVEVLGLRVGYRPPFPFPGLWLYAGQNEGDFGLVHLIGLDADDPSGLKEYLGDRDTAAAGTGALDHIAFLASDWPAMKRRCEAHGLSYAQRAVPTLGLRQVFLRDPSGVTIELNYPAEDDRPAG
ncbi:MAG: VOC family protein [Caulobacteraceae bacterium]|nr:VOC family protein [Caulobacteraceae bacterium]